VMATGHRPVMLERAVAALGLAPADSVVDATFGGGGHSRLILAGLGPDGSLVGIDRDPEAAGRASDLLQDPRFEFVSGAYDVALWAMIEERRSVDAILFDLGLSSFQVDEPGRGFSYTGEGPLDMRMDPRSGMTAADFLNTVDVGAR
jgi:16S rRNA (cytosine1402-N4)-methyltransferase